ncbi:TetR/AcrR family transcriptional regulator [Yinghuangia seranimata]|uniref:TetR/AcrR family transcriptional regulator n=1 Tax=Yinghuangia seranimata TaxID=408067 RepID=UPI00248B7076|nr:TetR/AcrR family transcriptional regulator [Yinghuangia seranimata]MDI2129547.1 helix-turn-helix domain-containing protein [Yinghuangia seranimata]
MGRKAKFTDDDFFDATLRVIAREGAAACTIADVAAELGAPVGSVYHRFASREELLARLWLRTVRRFQEPYLVVLGAATQGDAESDEPVRAVFRWVRQHPDEAQLLLLHRRRDLVARMPDGPGAEAATLNDTLEEAFKAYARRRFGRADRAAVERVTFALVDIPYAAIRRHLGAGGLPPRGLEALSVRTARAALAEDGTADT